MEIWLRQEDESIRLPILPKGYENVESFRNNSVTISNFGEVNLIGKRNLMTTNLSSFFPYEKYGFVQYTGFSKPEIYVKMLQSWMNAPIRYIITGTKINMLMTIEQFTYSEQDATRDIYYSLDLKEYRIPKIQIQSTNTTKTYPNKITQPDTKRESKTVKTTTYIVKKGDTLCAIARKFTGNSNNYKMIAQQNNIVNPNKIQIGQKLVITI